MLLIPKIFISSFGRTNSLGFSSVLFNLSVMSNTLRPHGLQHARLPCPSPAPGACSNSCLLRQRCHPTISSSAVPFSSAFDLSQHQGKIGLVLCIRWTKYWSFSFSISPSKVYSGLISLLSKGLSKVFSSTTVLKYQIFSPQPSL